MKSNNIFKSLIIILVIIIIIYFGLNGNNSKRESNTSINLVSSGITISNGTGNTSKYETSTIVIDGSSGTISIPSYIGKISSPKILKTLNKTSNSIKLTWDNIEEANKYIIYYGKVPIVKKIENTIEAGLDGGGFTNIVIKTNIIENYEYFTNPITTNEATITNLKSNTKYYFSIVAIDINGLPSQSSSSELEEVIDGKGIVALDKAINSNIATKDYLKFKGELKLVSKSDNSIKLEWDKVNGAKSYVIEYRKTNQNMNYEYIYFKTIPIDTNNITISNTNTSYDYYFSIIPIDKFGIQGEISSKELPIERS